MNKIVLAAVLLLMFSGMVSAMDTIRITNGEWAPYLSENLPEYGFGSQVVNEAFAAVGIQVQYGFFPWKRAYKLAKEGTWHGTVVWVHTPERAEYFYYSDCVVEDTEILFHLKDFELKWSVIEDLRGLKIGGTLHTVYPIFEQAEKKGILVIKRAGTYENLYRRLLKKRIDAIPQVKAVGAFLIRTKLTSQERQRITFSPTVIQERRYSLILSKAVEENKYYLERFNEGLRELHQSGRYQLLLDKLKPYAYDE